MQRHDDIKYSNTPRGAQDKQLLALTRSELPWTPLTIKREVTQTNQSVSRVISFQSHRQSVIR